MIRVHFRKIFTAILICAMISGTVVHAAETTPAVAETDEITQELIEKYYQFVNYQMARKSRGKVGTYESELTAFPSDYQTKLKSLHKEHPNWIFVAVDTGLDWNDVVDAEYSNIRSLIQKSNSSLLLSKASGHYDTSTGAYVPKDGSTWVVAAKQAVAYYVDPRNFLNENYIFMFEALDFNESYHTLQGVKNILAGTQLSNKDIVYVNTKGETVTPSPRITYEETIYAAGEDTGVSPLFLASKIKQETGAKLTNGSISGKYSYAGTSYLGYYNFYNIGATSTATGSAVANGLSYASKSGSYSRPWTSPVLAIKGGAEFLAASYIKKGQNTTYFQKFNTIVKPYYSHQYMQNLTGAASEGRSNYNSYVEEGIADNSYVFYIPVYENMPSQSSEVIISGAASKAKTTAGVNMRKGPSVSTSVLTNVPKGATVTIGKGRFTDESLSVYNQLSHPYWFEVTYGSYTGYISAAYLQLNSSVTIKVGGTKTLKVSGTATGEDVYYDSSAPTIANVNANGKITGLKEGLCTIYAISGSGKIIDAIGITVNKTEESDKEPEDTKTYTKYKTITRVNYRSGAGTSYEKIGTLDTGTTIEVEDGYSKSANGYTWVRFKLDGKNYYIADTYLEKVITLSKPILVSAEYRDEAVIVTWKKVSNAKGYYIYRKESGGSWSKIGTVSSESTVTYKDKTDLTEGKTYIYTVKAYAGSTVSGYNSTGVSVTIPEAKTYTKYKTTAKVNYRSGAGTSYAKKGTLEKGTVIEVEDSYSKSANGYTWVRFKLDGKNYYIAGKYIEKVITLSKPTLVSAKYDNGKVTVKWKKVANAKGYYVYRKLSGGSWKKIGTVKSGSTLTYKDSSSLSKGKTYVYTVKAYAGSTVGKYNSTGVSVKIPKTKTYTKYKTTASVNYRSGAGTSYAKKGTLAKGKTIEVENGYSKKANGYTWYRFKLKGKNYYIASKYVKKI